MRLPDKYARQAERIELKRRFADWNLRLTAYYTENCPGDPRHGLEELLKQGIDLLNEIIEKDQRELLASEADEEGHTYAEEFRACILDLKRRRRKLLGEGDIVLMADEVLVRMDSLL